MATNRIGAILVEMGVLTEADVQAVLEHQRRTRQKFGQIARAWGLVTDDQLREAWCLQIARYQPSVDPDEIGLDTEAVERVNGEVARYFNVLPLRLWGDHLVVATGELPSERPRLRELDEVVGCKVHFCLCDPEKIDTYLAKVYGPAGKPTAAS